MCTKLQFRDCACNQSQMTHALSFKSHLLLALINLCIRSFSNTLHQWVSFVFSCNEAHEATSRFNYQLVESSQLHQYAPPPTLSMTLSAILSTSSSDPLQFPTRPLLLFKSEINSDSDRESVADILQICEKNSSA